MIGADVIATPAAGFRNGVNNANVGGKPLQWTCRQLLADMAAVTALDAQTCFGVRLQVSNNASLSYIRPR